ncbi:cupin domain-containing protein [Streptomyces sp. NPDC002205]|uniref:cupin domain-containing protein n=1 Tax=Streptomyces sp. NPDC002205 TaxID=3154411 RepID=UPI00332BF0B2
MTIDRIRTITLTGGEPVVPEWPPGQASDDWTETEWRGLASADGRLVGGGWEGQAGTLLLDPYPYDEICVMVSGRIALVDTEGGRREFGAGDVFFVPRGFRGTWHTLEPSRKFFFAYLTDTEAV